MFSFFPDPTGSVQRLIDRFNEENGGGFQVRLREMPADSDQHFDQLNTEFQSGENSMDVIGATLSGWPSSPPTATIAGLSDRFTQEERGVFLPATIEANTYDGAIYGVPWYTDAGMLYYRRDLLERAPSSPSRPGLGTSSRSRRAVREGEDTRYVFQGAHYEGGVVDGLEYIWTSGGDVLDGDRVVIDSPEAVRGLAVERSMVADGIAPEGVSQYKEQEWATIFPSGDAVFMRNVPRMYALASDPAEPRIDQETIGVSALPVAEAGLRSYSSLGGWNLFLNANSENADAAYEFIHFMSAPEQQKFRAVEGSVLPTRQALYEDTEVLEKVRVAELGQETIRNTRPRPVSPFYSDVSLRMADGFAWSLWGEAPPEEVLREVKGELEEILAQGG